MPILIKGALVDYIVTSTPLGRTPADSYSAWATELGVSTTASLYAMDGDDAAYPIDFAVSPVAGGITRGFFSSEGGLGWYLSGTPSGSDSNPPPGVTRLYQLKPGPDWLLVFHPQVDCRSATIKLQKSGTTTIISGEIRSNSGSSELTEFAARFNGTADWQLDVRVVSGTLPIAFFTYQPIWSNRPNPPITRFDLATVTVGVSSTLTGVASAGTLAPATGLTAFLNLGIPVVTSPQPLVHLKNTGPPVRLVDRNYGGFGRIAGTVKEAGTPDHAVKRRVRLHRSIDGILVGETWSKPDGSYEFFGVAIQPYYVVSFDHTGNYNGVIKDSIIPELMP